MERTRTAQPRFGPEQVSITGASPASFTMSILVLFSLISLCASLSKIAEVIDRAR